MVLLASNMDRIIWTLTLILLFSVCSANDEVRNLGLFDELERYWWKIAKFTPEIEKINHFLEATVTDHNDKKGNIRALESMAAESANDLPLHQAIMTIVRLNTVLDSSCDGRSYVLLAEAYLLIGGEPSEYTNLNRVEQLVLGYGYEHKKLCLLKYVFKFERLIQIVKTDKQSSRLASDIDKLRDLFSHAFVNRLSGGSGDRENSATILEVKLTKFRVNDPALLKELVKKIKARMDVAHKSAKQYWNSLSIKQKAIFCLDEFRGRCERYCNAFKDIFKPTKFDVMTFSGKPSLVCDDSGSEFCNHWKLFRTCEAYVRAKKTKLIGKIELILDKNDW